MYLNYLLYTPIKTSFHKKIEPHKSYKRSPGNQEFSPIFVPSHMQHTSAGVCTRSCSRILEILWILWASGWSLVEHKALTHRRSHKCLTSGSVRLFRGQLAPLEPFRSLHRSSSVDLSEVCTWLLYSYMTHAEFGPGSQEEIISGWKCKQLCSHMWDYSACDKGV